MSLAASPDNVRKPQVDGTRLNLVVLQKWVLRVLRSNRELGQEIPDVAIREIHQP
jgi:hypothetical protein